MTSSYDSTVLIDQSVLPPSTNDVSYIINSSSIHASAWGRKQTTKSRACRSNQFMAILGEIQGWLEARLSAAPTRSGDSGWIIHITYMYTYLPGWLTFETKTSATLCKLNSKRCDKCHRADSTATESCENGYGMRFGEWIIARQIVWHCAQQRATHPSSRPRISDVHIAHEREKKTNTTTPTVVLD